VLAEDTARPTISPVTLNGEITLGRGGGPRTTAMHLLGASSEGNFSLGAVSAVATAVVSSTMLRPRALTHGGRGDGVTLIVAVGVGGDGDDDGVTSLGGSASSDTQGTTPFRGLKPWPMNSTPKLPTALAPNPVMTEVFGHASGTALVPCTPHHVIAIAEVKDAGAQPYGRGTE
jgi:hypothetical protein